MEGTFGSIMSRLHAGHGVAGWSRLRSCVSQILQFQNSAGGVPHPVEKPPLIVIPGPERASCRPASRAFTGQDEPRPRPGRRLKSVETSALSVTSATGAMVAAAATSAALMSRCAHDRLWLEDQIDSRNIRGRHAENGDTVKAGRQGQEAPAPPRGQRRLSTAP